MKAKWLWAALALVLLGAVVVVVGGYPQIQREMTPFEEKTPADISEANAQLATLEPQILATYKRWQWIDALFVLCYATAMAIVFAVAKRRFSWGSWWTIACATLLAVLLASEAMENTTIIGVINGNDRLGLLRLGTGAKWIVFPIGAGTSLALLIALGVAQLRKGRDA